MPRGGAEVVTIMWRDIPAQVNGQRGRERHQVALSAKFQRAIDRAKRKAGIVTADEDVSQWRRVGVALDGDADRVILCDENGEVIDGDQVMAVIARSWQAAGRPQAGKGVAAVMSNPGLERYLPGVGAGSERAKGGARHVR